MLRAAELRSRGVRSLPPRLFGSLVGHLLLRSMDRAGRIHRAMAARGFDGRIRVQQPPVFRWADGGFVLGWLAFFAAVRAWNLAHALGRVLTGEPS
jgi:cobalt/nickel transport system permease protein